MPKQWSSASPRHEEKRRKKAHPLKKKKKKRKHVTLIDQSEIRAIQFYYHPHSVKHQGMGFLMSVTAESCILDLTKSFCFGLSYIFKLLYSVMPENWTQNEGSEEKGRKLVTAWLTGFNEGLRAFSLKTVNTVMGNNRAMNGSCCPPPQYHYHFPKHISDWWCRKTIFFSRCCSSTNQWFSVTLGKPLRTMDVITNIKV